MNMPLDGYADAITSKMPGEQGSPEWLAARVGNCTASRFKDVMDFQKSGKEGAKRAAYRMELVIERITGISAEHFVSDAMQWGIDTEPLARMAYEGRTGAMVLVPGYRRHPTAERCGGSVDGLIGDDGMLEIKCPNTATHIKTLLAQSCEEHYPQIMGYLWITGRAWCDFVSYDPRLPDGLQLYVQRVKRDDTYISELAASVLQFLSEVDAIDKKLLLMVDKHAEQSRQADDVPPLEL